MSVVGKISHVETFCGDFRSGSALPFGGRFLTGFLALFPDGLRVVFPVAFSLFSLWFSQKPESEKRENFLSGSGFGRRLASAASPVIAVPVAVLVPIPVPISVSVGITFVLTASIS